MSCEARKVILNQSLLLIYVPIQTFIIEYLLNVKPRVEQRGKCASLNIHSTRAKLFSLLYFCLAQCLTHRRHLLTFVRLMNQHIQKISFRVGEKSSHRHVPVFVLFKNPMRYLHYSNIMENALYSLSQSLPSKLFTLRVKACCVYGRKREQQREIC